jgi:hypothetical protein
MDSRLRGNDEIMGLRVEGNSMGGKPQYCSMNAKNSLTRSREDAKKYGFPFASSRLCVRLNSFFRGNDSSKSIN